MASNICKAQRGTYDILPADSHKWQFLEQAVRDVGAIYGYGEVRTPVFEATELFTRSIGEATDVVCKEMYTFEDRRGRSLTLRPEGTAGVVRAFVEHKLYNSGLPAKFYYIGPMFRYERPQAGRYRQFHQFGFEALGSGDPLLDVEMVLIATDICRRLGLDTFTVLLNSIGCPACRLVYLEALRSHLAFREASLCRDCRDRLERNPLRLLDCKREECRRVTADIPLIDEYLCDECRSHFARVQRLLRRRGVEVERSARLVRGLDYYTKTVFEIISPDLGAQDAIAGGGRYDGLIEQCGGPALGGVGFACGMDRLLLALEEAGIAPWEVPSPVIYVAAVGEEAREQAIDLALELRRQGLSTELDYMDRSLRAQLRAADRQGVGWAVILGEDELSAGVATVRRMQDGMQVEIPLVDLVARLERMVEETG